MSFQQEHKEWLARLYPSQQPIEPAVGLLEETGELAHVLLKCQQSRGWKHPEERHANSDWNKKFLDAVGDCGIFACSLCNANGWNFDELVKLAASCNATDKLYFVEGFKMVGGLAQQAAACISDPDNSSALVRYFRQLLAICSTWNIDFYKAVTITWLEVKERK